MDSFWSGQFGDTPRSNVRNASLLELCLTWDFGGAFLVICRFMHQANLRVKAHFFFLLYSYILGGGYLVICMRCKEQNIKLGTQQKIHPRSKHAENINSRLGQEDFLGFVRPKK